MAITTAEEFFVVLEKSHLLIPARLAQARDITGSGDAPRTIAKTLARQGLITRWQAGQLLAGRSSFFLGKYRLIELLGRGGSGNVLLAEHVTMNRRVALKIVPRLLCRDPVALKRFLAEIPAIAALDHPNVARVYSVDNQGDRYYLVREYLEGVDLQRLVEQQGPLACDRAVDYTTQAADGLEHAHQQSRFDCGIRPSNLLVNAEGVVKILDLGLTRLGDQGPTANEADPRAADGANYLAPEQAGGSPCRDGRADIYSLGCTLYFQLAGHPPFPRETPSERIAKHRTRPRPDLHAHRSDVPAELAAVCMKMMAIRPEDRYPTAVEAGLALVQGRASSARPKPAEALPRAKRLEEP